MKHVVIIKYVILLSLDVPKINRLKQLTDDNHTLVNHNTKNCNHTELTNTLIKNVLFYYLLFIEKEKLYCPIIFYFKKKKTC